MTLAAGEREVAAGRRERLTRSLRSAATRIATVGDQLLVALTNFGLTIAIGRAFGADELAAYGIGLSVGLMVQGLQRHAVTIPLMLHPAGWVRERKTAIVGEQMLVLLPGLLAGLLSLVAAYVWPSSFVHLILLSSAVCLFVYLQLEFARAFLVKLGKAALLLAGAAAYAAVAAALAVAALRGVIGYDALLVSIAGAMIVHACVVAIIGGGIAIRAGGSLLAADMKRYGGWALAATGTYAGYNHVPLLILGAVAAPIQAAVFIAARSLMQPLQILLRGLDIADKNAFAELQRDQLAPRFILRLVVLYAVVGVALGAMFSLASEWLLALAYGQKFAGYGNAVIAWAFAYALISVSMPLESLVYARNRFAGYFAIRGVASAIAIAAAFPLIQWYGAVGAISACALGWLVAVAGTGAMLVRGGGAR